MPSINYKIKVALCEIIVILLILHMVYQLFVEYDKYIGMVNRGYSAPFSVSLTAIIGRHGVFIVLFKCISAYIIFKSIDNRDL